jgi:hypothetical protein
VLFFVGIGIVSNGERFVLVAHHGDSAFVAVIRVVVIRVVVIRVVVVVVVGQIFIAHGELSILIVRPAKLGVFAARSLFRCGVAICARSEGESRFFSEEAREDRNARRARRSAALREYDEGNRGSESRQSRKSDEGGARDAG